MSDKKKKFQPAEILWFNDAKGFGYAKDMNGNLIFIHYTAIESDYTGRRTLSPKQKIEVDSEEELGEFRAKKVREVRRDA